MRTEQAGFPVTILGVGLTVLFCALAQGQGVGFGPKPVYLHPLRQSWTFTLNRPPAQVREAALSAAEELGLSVTELEETGGLDFRIREVTGAQLDQYCTYPIFNYKTWKPTSSFAIENRDAIRNRLSRESPRDVALRGVVSLQLLSAADGEGAYTLQSLCAARLKLPNVIGQALVQSTPNGSLGKRFLEQLFKELGIAATVQAGPIARLEPSRKNPTRDLYIARNCLGGVSVDPESRELVCVGPTQIRKE